MARNPKKGLPTPAADDDEERRRRSEERDRLQNLAEQEEWKGLTHSERQQRRFMRDERAKNARMIEERRQFYEERDRARWAEEAPIRAREAEAAESRRLEQLERDTAAEQIRSANAAEERRLQAEAIAEASERARWRPPPGKSLREQVHAYNVAIQKVLDHGPATKEVVRTQVRKNLPRS